MRQQATARLAWFLRPVPVLAGPTTATRRVCITSRGEPRVRTDVDALHEMLIKIGAIVLDVPTEYPQYNKGNGYYAVFFADTDGLKLEFAYTSD